MRKRITFLFGAGAMLPWHAPTTSELTTLIRQSGFMITDNKTTITEFIFQQLAKNGFQEADINFETIINVIEELIVYYSLFDTDKNVPSLIKCFFSNDFASQILNFSVKGEVKHGYSLQIPKGKDYLFSGHSSNNETPEQFFLLHLLNVLLTEISSRISEYAWHTASHSIVETESSISQSFSKWMRTHSENNLLRLYTLNYDRIFKILLERASIRVFDGFEYVEAPPLGKKLRADIPKILNDSSSNVCYNLHGCANWEVLDRDNKQLPNPEVVMSDAIHLQINNDMASAQMEKGKTLLVTNIITGYQKAQKSIISPFRQMQSSFDKDCCNTDELYIIGYSFGDEHINQSLKTAVKYNERIKLIIIDPLFIKNNGDHMLTLKYFPNINSRAMNPLKVSDNLYSYFDGRFTVHTKTFENFLNTTTTSRFNLK